MRTVSARLERRIARDFPRPNSAKEVIRILATVADSERSQAAIVFAADRDLQELQRQADLAAIDWRDVLANGGLANEDWLRVLDSELGPDRTS